MGKSWKNAGKIENAQKKGMVFTKLAREIQVAAKLGGADPNMNARLRMAVDAAKKASCPVDTIERAIKKGAGLLDDGKIIEEVTYEGYGPHGVGVIVECQTDNRHRTAPEIRNAFKKHDGNMGESGSVAWMFTRVGLIEGTKEGSFDPEEEAIEAGANEVSTGDDEGTFEFIVNFDELDSVKNNLASRGWKITKAEPSFKANTPTELTPEQLKEVEEFLNYLDDMDDTHRVHATLS
ncbi:MAG: YebC/PmpR family DNA-binding transcriptional regulator [Bdellovibrionia bacterium]